MLWVSETAMFYMIMLFLVELGDLPCKAFPCEMPVPHRYLVDAGVNPTGVHRSDVAGSGLVLDLVEKRQTLVENLNQ